MRIYQTTNPFGIRCSSGSLNGLETSLPAKWIRPSFFVTTPAQVAFRCGFSINEPMVARLHVSADERYQLFLDGKPIGRGPDLGDQENWYFDTYELALAPGEHMLVARVLMVGAHCATAQISLAHGLLVCPDQESPLVPMLATGLAPWMCKLLPGLCIGEHVWSLQATGPMTLDAREFPWGYETGGGESWSDAVSLQAASLAPAVFEYGHSMHLLRPSMLPPQLELPMKGVVVRQVDAIPEFDDDLQPFATESTLHDEQEVLSKGSLTIPAHTIRRVLLQFDDYFCFYYAITVSGGRGGRMRVATAERLFGAKVAESPWCTKVPHDGVEGSFFEGPSDRFILDGGNDRKLEPYWWRCGRWVQIVVATGDESLTISRMEFRETRYPLEMQSSFATSDEKLESILSICFRTLQACCHDIYVDCPYYEQTQWVGDMRVQMLCHYVATNDVRQIKKALLLVDNSAALGGMVRAYYPAVNRLLIPGFALWHIASLHDLALWRGEKEFVRGLMPQARATMDAILRHTREDGLIAWPPGWPFTDWAEGFPNGNPPGGAERTESIFNFQAVHVLDLLADLEEYLEENELASRWRRLARTLAEASNKLFWDSSRGLFAVDLDHKCFCEHSQCMAAIGGRISPEQQASIADKLTSDHSITRVQLFYSHYLFEVYRSLGRVDALFARMEPWYRSLEMGLKTAPETFPDTRSDCHAWSAHPLFHFFTSILGIRPTSMGFESVEIAPQLGPLRHAAGRLVHPNGWIEVELCHSDDKITGIITLPEGIVGTAKINGRTVALRSGEQRVS